VQHGNETETVFSFVRSPLRDRADIAQLQVMTACTASFAHGANDVCACSVCGDSADASSQRDVRLGRHLAR